MKKKISIGEIGNNFQRFDKIVFDSDQSLLDYDLIFLDLNFISGVIGRDGHSIEGMKANKIWAHKKYEPLLKKRANELTEFIEEQRFLIVILPKPQEFQLFQGQFTAGLYKNVDLLPFDLKLDAIEGSKIDIDGKGNICNVLKKYSAYLQYRSSFVHKMELGNPLARIKGTNKVIASEYENVCFIPSIKPVSFSELTQIDEFGSELAECFFNKEVLVELPEWASHYKLPEEDEIMNQRDLLLSQIDELKKKLELKESQLQSLQELKFLFTGTGDSLENKVAFIFKELGFEILESDSFRDDLIVKYNGKVAVIEIKGVSKSATEEHAMQLEKWISEYYLDRKEMPKGILIVNGYRDVELKKRGDVVFTNQMKKFSEKRDHCLVSAIQLLGLYFFCKTDSSRKDHLINTLFETIGQFDEFKNWESFISKSE